MADRNESIGPQLPPHLRHLTGKGSDDSVGKGDQDGHVGVEPAPLAISPTQKREQKDTFGPALPPGLEIGASETSIGPALPPGWSKDTSSNSEGEEDEDVIGPLPSSSSITVDDSQTKYEIDSRARAMKDKLQGKTKECAPKREAWMTELPPELGANIGIVARTFKKKTLNTSESDRSVWTDTPADRERKARDRIMKKSGSEKAVEEPVERQRDIEMKKRIEDHNMQYRSASLMELHQEERKKKKGDGPTERRPFDRSTDLDLKKIDKKGANKFIRGATGVNSKFENAKFESKYL